MGTKATVSSSGIVVEGLISGFTEDPPASLTTVTVQGKAEAVPDVITELKAIDARYVAVTMAREALALAVAARREADAEDMAYVKSVVASLKVQFEGNQQQLNAFRIAAAKPRKAPSPEQKVVAKAKADATREARGTMSRKQRLAITAAPTPTVTVTGIPVAATSANSASAEPPPAAAPAAASPPAAKQ